MGARPCLDVGGLKGRGVGDLTAQLARAQRAEAPRGARVDPDRAAGPAPAAQGVRHTCRGCAKALEADRAASIPAPARGAARVLHARLACARSSERGQQKALPGEGPRGASRLLRHGQAGQRHSLCCCQAKGRVRVSGCRGAGAHRKPCWPPSCASSCWTAALRSSTMAKGEASGSGGSGPGPAPLGRTSCVTCAQRPG